MRLQSLFRCLAVGHIYPHSTRKRGVLGGPISDQLGRNGPHHGVRPVIVVVIVVVTGYCGHLG